MSRPILPDPLAAQVPAGTIAVPERVRSLAHGDDIEAVWRNDLGGLTFRVGAGSIDERFIKWVRAGVPEFDFADEAERGRWAFRFSGSISAELETPRFRCPEVIEHGEDDAGSWLVTRAIVARSAIAPENLDRPDRAARAIGAGLRALHDALPVSDCPFVWSIDQRLSAVDARLAAGIGPSQWSPEFRGLTVSQALAELAELPAPSRLVVCHGDPCAPNALLTPDGQYAAHVDFDELGVADPLADLSVAAWSTVWNYGPGYESAVYDGYGVRPDPERIRAYRLLWDLS